MAATSLSLQLGNLRKKADKINLKTGPDVKHRPSFLFRGNEATHIDRDTVYRLGYNALIELGKLDPRFKDFCSSLFSESAKHLERSVSDKKENEELDEEISRFFVILAPFIQLGPALTVLEWLIVRFHIEKFNGEQMLLMFLPFHELKLFTRALQVLFPRDDKNQWHWTFTAAKAGQIINKDELLKFFAKRIEYIQFAADFCVRIHQEHSSRAAQYYSSFVVIMLVAAIERQKKALNETQVAAIVKIIKTLVVPSQTDLQSAACSAMLVLLHQTQLENKALNTLLTMMVRKCDDSITLSVFQLVLMALDKQEFFTPSQKLLSRLFEKGLPHLLSMLAAEVEIAKCTPMHKFVVAVVQNFEELDGEICHEVISGFMAEGPIRKEAFAEIMYEYLSKAVSEGRDVNALDLRLVTFFMKKYCECFDLAISKLKESHSQEVVDGIMTFVETNDSSSTLGLQLGSASDDFRMAGLKSLKKKLAKNKTVDADIGYHLINCLKTEAVEMKKAVLELGDSLWTLTSPETLAQALLEELFSWKNIESDDILRLIHDLLAHALSLKPEIVIAAEVLKYRTKSQNWNVKANLGYDLKDSSRFEKMAQEEEEAVLSKISSVLEEDLSHKSLLCIVFVCGDVFITKMSVALIKKLIQKCSSIASDCKLFCLKSMQEKLNPENKPVVSWLMERVLETYAPKIPEVAEITLENVVKNESLDLVLYVTMNIICSHRELLVTLLKLLNTKFLFVLRLISSLSKSSFGDREQYKQVLVSTWEILPKLIVACESQGKCEAKDFLWPLFKVLCEKSVTVRQTALKACEILKKTDKFVLLLDEILDNSAEITSDKSYPGLVFEKFSKRKEKDISSIVAQLLDAVKEESAAFLLECLPLISRCAPHCWKFLDEILSLQCTKNELPSIELSVSILGFVDCSNVPQFSKGIFSCLSEKRNERIVETAVSLLTPEVFNCFQTDEQVPLFRALTQLYTIKSKVPSVSRVIGDLPIGGSLLYKVFDLPEFDTSSKPKRHRSDSFTPASLNLTQIRVLLDFLSQTKNLSDPSGVFSTINSLLSFLERAWMLENDNKYVSLILHCLSTLKLLLSNCEVHSDSVDSDLLLNFMQVFSLDANVQTQCVHVLTTYLHQCRDDVSEKVLAIFAAINNSLNARNDDFTFQLTVSVMEKLLVPLMRSKKDKDFEIFLVRVVESLRDLSSPRQILLMSELLRHIDSESLLWQLAIVFLSQSEGTEIIEKAIATMEQVLIAQESSILLSSIFKMMQFSLDLRRNELVTELKLVRHEALSDKQKRIIVFQVLAIIPEVVQSQQLLDQLVRDQKSLSANEKHFTDILKTLFDITDEIKPIPEEEGTSKAALFNKSLSAKANNCLKALSLLFDDNTFIRVISEVVNEEKESYSIKGLDILQSRILKSADFLSRIDEDNLSKLYECAVKSIESQSQQQKQLAALILIRVVKARSVDVEELVIRVAPLLKNADDSYIFKGQLCALIAEIVKAMKLSFLPHLDGLMECLLDENLLAETRLKPVYEGYLCCILALLETLSEMMIPHFVNVIKFLLPFNDLPKAPGVVAKLDKINTRFAQMELRVVISALSEVFASLVGERKVTSPDMKHFLQLVHLCVEENGRKDLEANQRKLVNFFLKVLDIRKLSEPELVEKMANDDEDAGDQEDDSYDIPETDSPSRKRKKLTESKKSLKKAKKIDVKDLENDKFVELEDLVVASIISYTLKSTEASIRPTLVKIFEWASCDPENPQRILTFYSMLSHLAFKIKGLIILFISAYTSHMKQCLSETESPFNTSCQLFLNSKIIQCLSNAFVYDSTGVFATKERVDLFASCLSSQYETWYKHEDYRVFADEVLSPCLANFMTAACKDEEARQIIHRNILHYARHEAPVVRRSMLIGLRLIATKLGNEYSLYYHEAIPYLAELKDDDSAEVELECDHALRAMEAELGDVVTEHFPRLE